MSLHDTVQLLAALGFFVLLEHSILVSAYTVSQDTIGWMSQSTTSFGKPASDCHGSLSAQCHSSSDVEAIESIDSQQTACEKLYQARWINSTDDGLHTLSRFILFLSCLLFIAVLANAYVVDRWSDSNVGKWRNKIRYLLNVAISAFALTLAAAVVLNNAREAHVEAWCIRVCAVLFIAGAASTVSIYWGFEHLLVLVCEVILHVLFSVC